MPDFGGIAGRFWPKVDQSGECWVWLGAKDAAGYGQMRIGGECVGAHRVAYELAAGCPVPPRHVIDHLCRNPSCVNPGHLEPVSMLENTRRGILFPILSAKARQQTHCKRGHPLFGDNLKVTRRGRSCITCQRMLAAAWKIKNRGRVNAMQRARRHAGGR